MQVVGKSCAACQRQIHIEMDACFCRQCRNLYHKACLTGDELCPKCLGTVGTNFGSVDRPVQTVPNPAVRHVKAAMALLGIGAVFIGIILIAKLARTNFVFNDEMVGTWRQIDESGQMLDRIHVFAKDGTVMVYGGNGNRPDAWTFLNSGKWNRINGRVKCTLDARRSASGVIPPDAAETTFIELDADGKTGTATEYDEEYPARTRATFYFRKIMD